MIADTSINEIFHECSIKLYTSPNKENSIEKSYDQLQKIIQQMWVIKIL